ncbi:murein hydrolase activator EnvC family protein [Solimonas marina]|uniref:Peptidoglycan DD-metalloendopeptidase family protein n=1 Tax=Solimonas marina TaxID=2714601 RepID=A0A969W849_9GAMM|nr:peptidoglycan DD-metalloendopeptidase family protein [Solimonas marina]NKF20701.1 peptidoglycan DD-metalloendopeptidase family protein [Solimonas marina]
MFRRASCPALALAAVLAAVCLPAGADSIGDKQKALDTVRDKISALQKQVESDRGTRDDLARQMQDVERKLADARQAVREVDAKLDAQQRKISDTEAQQAQAQAALAARRDSLARQVRAEYILGRQGETQLLLNLDDAQTVGRMLSYYGYLQRAQLAAIAQIREHAQQLQALADRLQEENDQLVALQQDQKKTLADLQGQQQARAGLLTQLKSRLSGEEDNLAQLKADERSIRKLIESLKKALATLPPDVTPSNEAFTKLRGKLPWPVRGTLLARYGDGKADGRLKWNGDWIAASEGTPVRSVARGRAVYVGWMHRYGLIVLVEHDGGYFSLYGHCAGANVKVGDPVRAGQTIATAGNTGGYEQAGVYFEIRKGADAVNPNSWLAR